MKTKITLHRRTRKAQGGGTHDDYRRTMITQCAQKAGIVYTTKRCLIVGGLGVRVQSALFIFALAIFFHLFRRSRRRRASSATSSSASAAMARGIRAPISRARGNVAETCTTSTNASASADVVVSASVFSSCAMKDDEQSRQCKVARQTDK